MNESVTVVVTAVFNPEELQVAQSYMQGAIPLLLKGGGEIISRVRAERALVGEARYDACMVLRFPSVSAVEAIFASPEYAALVPLRKAGFKSVDVVVANAM
ncbi:MAG: DUF1330 domain-containing protein [Kofleriaceae bacterium]